MPTPFPPASHRLYFVPVTPDDFSELLGLYNSNPDYMEYAFGKRVVTLETVEQDHKDNLAFPDSYSVLLREQCSNALVGISQFILRNPRDQQAWLGLIMLDHHFQGKGYAREFLDLLINWYAENGYSSLHLAVLEKNQVVIPIYEKLGFSVYEERVTPKLGRVICMKYEIGTGDEI